MQLQNAIGLIEYVSLTKELLPDVVNFMRNSFFVTENLSTGVGLPQNPEAVAELDEVVLDIAYAGISIAAVEKGTKRVVGVSLNKTQTQSEDNFYVKYIESVTYPSAKGFLEVLSEAEGYCDFFEHCKVDCVGEIMLLGVLQSHRRRGIAKKLLEISYEILARLSKGENVKQPCKDNQVLNLGVTPKIATALFTSFVTQKLGRQLNFVFVTKVPTEELKFNGKPISGAIGNHTPAFTLEYKRF